MEMTESESHPVRLPSHSGICALRHSEAKALRTDTLTLTRKPN